MGEMRMIGVALFVLLQISATTGDPLAPATAGLLQCFSPDEGEKTCQSLDTFHPLANGKYRDSAIALIPTDPPMTFEFSSLVESKGSSFCSTIRASDLAKARIKRAGRPLPASQQSAMRKFLLTALAPSLNKETCAVLEDTPEGLVARAKVNGVYDPGLDQFVKWVHPADGYRVGP
jgi:hypothetical protein